MTETFDFLKDVVEACDNDEEKTDVVVLKNVNMSDILNWIKIQIKLD